MELKDTKCKSCKALRKQNDFIYNDKVNKSCCVCRDRRLKMKKYMIEYNKKDKIKEYKKEYNEENKQKINEKQKKYNEENKEYILEYKKEKYQNEKQENPLKVKIIGMINKSRQSDKERNRTYDENEYVDYDFLNDLWNKQEGKCGYNCCKCEMVLTFNKDTRNPYQVSIQRLDNNIAHIKSNIMLSCFMCNVIKHMENEL